MALYAVCSRPGHRRSARRWVRRRLGHSANRRVLRGSGCRYGGLREGARWQVVRERELRRSLMGDGPERDRPPVAVRPRVTSSPSKPPPSAFWTGYCSTPRRHSRRIPPHARRPQPPGGTHEHLKTSAAGGDFQLAATGDINMAIDTYSPEELSQASGSGSATGQRPSPAGTASLNLLAWLQPSQSLESGHAGVIQHEVADFRGCPAPAAIGHRSTPRLRCSPVL